MQHYADAKTPVIQEIMDRTNESTPDLIDRTPTLSAGGPRTLTTAGHQSLVRNPDVLSAYDSGAFRALSQPMAAQTIIEGDALLERHVRIDDCLFRMLTPDEIKLGMAFARHYIPLGTKRENVRQCGYPARPARHRRLSRGGDHRGADRAPVAA